MLKLLSQFVLVLAATVVFFAFTDPNSLPVSLLVVPLILVFLNFYLFSRIVFGAVSAGNLRSGIISRYSIAIGAIASLIVLFQSTGGIIWTDIILLALLIAVGYFYINRI